MSSPAPEPHPLPAPSQRPSRLLTQNRELRPIGVWNWSLPAWAGRLPDGRTYNTCPSAGICRHVCYACSTRSCIERKTPSASELRRRGFLVNPLHRRLNASTCMFAFNRSSDARFFRTMEGGIVDGRGELPPGSARSELTRGVLLLRPEDAVLDAMLAGWEKQQRGGRRLRQETVDSRKSVVRRFVEYTNEYPWRWTAVHMDEWTAELVMEQALAESTLRNYQGAIRMFCDYITSPHYDWASECEARFSTHPVQIVHEWNTVAHLVDCEGGPGRRPLTREECQALFDYADDQVERAVRLGRKGALTAYRDSTVLKVLYGWGLRVAEASKLERVDWYRNPKAPELGKFGMLNVRWGKRSRGSPPKRRMVASTMPWAVEAVDDYLVNVRPRFGLLDHPAMWVTERGGRLRPREIEERFALYRDALGMDSDLVPHSLRHSHVTHLIEDGADPKFVQEQVGHRFASTTAIYTGVSGDFMNTMLRRHLDRGLITD